MVHRTSDEEKCQILTDADTDAENTAVLTPEDGKLALHSLLDAQQHALDNKYACAGNDRDWIDRFLPRMSIVVRSTMLTTGGLLPFYLTSHPNDHAEDVSRDQQCLFSTISV